MKRALHRTMYTLALIGIGVASCSDSNTTTTSALYDPYYYYGYYPADVYYSSYYWSDPYYFYASYGNGSSSGSGTSSSGSGTVTPGTGGTAGTTVVSGTGGTTVSGSGGAGGTAGTSGGTEGQSLGDLVRALARGESVCGSADQVAVTPKTAASACPSAGHETVRAGVTLAFNGCQLTNGGTLDGTIDVTSTRTASDAVCSTNTTVALSHTATLTNLTYTGVNGRRIVFPTQTGTGTVNYVFGQPPPAVPSTVEGRMQVYGLNNVLLADQVYSGNMTITVGQNRSYSVDSSLTLQDQRTTGTTTLTTSGLTRTSDCCRPTGGSLSISRTGTNAFGSHTWSFGPSCGAAKFDNGSITLPACL